MEKQFEEEEVEIDLKEILLVLLYQWKMILLSAVLIGVIVFSYCNFVATPMYESTSKLYVLSKSTSITSLTDIQSGTSLTNDYLVVVNCRPVIEEVIENLGLDETYESLCADLSVTNPDDTRILNITYTDEDAELAKEVVDEIASVASDYISDKMDQDAPTTIENGYSDGEAVSPDTMKNTILGAVIGAVVAAAIVILTHIFNDKIMTTNEMEKYLGLNTLAVVPFDGDFGADADSKKAKKSRRKK